MTPRISKKLAVASRKPRPTAIQRKEFAALKLAWWETRQSHASAILAQAKQKKQRPAG